MENSSLETMIWKDGTLYLLDQRLLPQKVAYLQCNSYSDVIAAIKSMTVRGAPAIGISAAYGFVLAARHTYNERFNQVETRAFMDQASSELVQARPTAVNLPWAIKRLEKCLREHQDASGSDLVRCLEQEAILIHEEDLENNRQIGKHGASLVPLEGSVLTHCNAGALATGGYGTALGVIRAAFEQGKNIHVYVDETRPLMQGARITAFELHHAGIPATLVTDNCAGYLMANSKINLVIVGADRIAVNGDAANKIGTYSLAVLARYHEIPFYIAAPLSTIDRDIESGKDIIIEERCCSEITTINDRCLAPEGMAAFNPAFDVTPAELISAIITENGVIRRPDRDGILKQFDNQGGIAFEKDRN